MTNSLDSVSEIAKKLNSDPETRRDDLVHLDTYLGALRYTKKAKKIANDLKKDALVLDLGCGAGQISYLLAREGINVVASDIFPTTPPFVEYFNNSSTKNKITYIKADLLQTDSHDLTSKKFDAVIIYGVLEHVPNFSLFLERTNNLLHVHGLLYVGQFPNRWSWREKLGDLFNNTSHEIRLSNGELNFMLRWHGFQVLGCGYEQILPMNLRGLPGIIHKVYSAATPIIFLIDRVLCSIPIVNLLGTSIWVTCRKARCKS